MKNGKREIIFEIARIGSIARVTAIDAETGTEAVVQCPASTGQAEMQRVAAAKLDYVIRKAAGK